MVPDAHDAIWLRHAGQPEQCRAVRLERTVAHLGRMRGLRRNEAWGWADALNHGATISSTVAERQQCSQEDTSSV